MSTFRTPTRKTFDTPYGPAFSLEQFRRWYACALIPGHLIRKVGTKRVIMARDADRWNATLPERDRKRQRIKRRVPQAV